MLYFCLLLPLDLSHLLLAFSFRLDFRRCVYRLIQLFVRLKVQYFWVVIGSVCMFVKC